MPRPLARLFVDHPLAPDGGLSLDGNQSHYLKDVLRLSTNDQILLFNGQHGEWQADITAINRKSVAVTINTQTRPQSAGNGPRLVFAPVKKSNTDFIIEKATELGAGRLSPVMTAFTDTNRANLSRFRANAIEAAEQCGRLDVPAIDPPVKLQVLMDEWPADDPVVVADESGSGMPILDVMRTIAARPVRAPAFVIGPQGGFSESELVFLRGLSFVSCVDLGPRILRAETAAVAVLTCWQAACGDWIPPAGG